MMHCKREKDELARRVTKFGIHKVLFCSKLEIKKIINDHHTGILCLNRAKMIIFNLNLFFVCCLLCSVSLEVG